MAKPMLFFSAAILFVLAAAPAPGKMPQEGKGGAKAAAANETQAKAKKIYAVDCAMCHGDNGNGQTDLATSMQLKLADWTDPKTLSDKSDQALIEVIRKGKDKMPAEDSGRAKDEEVKALVDYIRNFSKAQAAPAAKASN